MAKAGANYMNSQLIRMEAIANGYAEGIALDANGCVSEGSGENIFIVRDGSIYTPPLASSVLPGITRATIITLCEDLGIPVREEMIRAKCFTSQTSSFSPAPPPKSRRCVPSTASPSAPADAGPSPSACKRNFSPFSPAPSPTGTTGSRPLPRQSPPRANTAPHAALGNPAHMVYFPRAST